MSETEGIEEYTSGDIPSKDDGMEFNYEVFLRHMRHPSCRPLLHHVKSVINHFMNTPRPATEPALTALIHIYRGGLDQIMELVRENPVWRLLGEGHPEQYEMAREGLEYLIMNQVQGTVFAVIPEDQRHDKLLWRQMSIHAPWLQPHHLDISSEIAKGSLVNDAIDQFRRVSQYLTPRDKLICLLNGCRIVQRAGRSIDGEEGEEGDHISADEIMPLLIYCLLKAQVSHLHSNLQYISRFRNQRELASDKAYHFTSLLAATTFIEKMDASTLIIDAVEYGELTQNEIDKLGDQPLPLTPGDDHDYNITSPTSRLVTSEDQFKAEATRLLQSVKEKLKLGASRSIEYIGELMDRAEAKLKAIGSPPGHTSDHHDDAEQMQSVTGEDRDRILAEEDEFQMQLAMALSLSEIEYQKGGDPRAEERREQPTGTLIDMGDDAQTKSSPDPEPS